MKAEDKRPYYQTLSEQLTRLLGHLIAKQEAQHQQLALALNDTILQSLIVLQVQLFALTREAISEPNEKAQATLNDSLKLVETLVDNLRALARGLRPIELNTIGLAAALQQASEEFRGATQIEVVYEDEEGVVLPERETTFLFRLSEEVFDNIRKHAEATKVRVKLHSNAQSVWLEIEDNGKGFLSDGDITDPLNAPGLGLLALMIYAQQLNGRILIRSQLGQGTSVTAVLPQSK